MKKLPLFLVFLIALVACHTPNVSQSSLVSGYDFKLYGQFTQQEINELHVLVNIFPKPVINSIKFIAKVDASHFKDNDAGHCWQDGRICIRNNYVNDPNVVWHEIAHAHTWHVISYNTNNFEKEWKEVAGDNVYRGKKDINWEYPRDGLVTGYSRSNWMEDSAEFVTEFYKIIYNYKSAFKFLSKEDWGKDNRYQAKTDLLYKYGFVSKNDYNTFNKIFKASP